MSGTTAIGKWRHVILGSLENPGISMIELEEMVRSHTSLGKQGPGVLF